MARDVLGFHRGEFERQAALTMLHIWWMTPLAENELDGGLPDEIISKLPIVLQSQYTVELANRRDARKTST